MNEEALTFYEKSNDIWGLPQTYKEIKFYPLKVKDVYYQDLFHKIFTYPKNFIPDKTILKMSYLKFIMFSGLYQNMEDTIVEYLKYITKIDSIKVENRQINVNLELDVDNFDIRIMIDNTEISEYEFDILREIILEQNGLSIEYINQYHPELEQKLAQSMSFNNLTFEDEIFTFSILMRKSLDEIGDYTSYQLKNLMERMFVLKQFDLYKPLEVSGQIKMQGGSEIKPYLYHEESKSRYGSILVDADKFMNANKDIFADN